MISTQTMLGALVVVVVRLAYVVYRRAVVKSPLRNLPGPPVVSWRTGHLGHLYNPSGMSWHHELNQTYGGACLIKGIMGDEHLYVSDPKALHQICVKDQDIFEETSMFVQGNSVIFGDGLLSTVGEVHKRQRKILNPVFSTSHMRDVTPILYDVVGKLVGLMKSATKTGPAKMDMLDLMMRTALEGIGQGGLGHSYKALESGDGNSAFRVALRSLIPTIFSLQIERQILPFILSIGTPEFRGKLVDLVPNKRLHRLRDIVNEMYHTNLKVFQEKKRALKEGDEKVMQQIGQGRDIVSVLLRGMEEADEEDRLTDAEVLAQLTTLVFTSHDTTSSTLAHLLHLLALHPEIQERLRKEIKDAKDAWERDHTKGDRDLGYDEVNDLPFLENVCRETLRLHAPVTFMSRTARAPSVLPLTTPMTGTDGKLISEVPVRTNQNVHIGIAAANRHPAYWGPDAGEWVPDRWANGIPKLAQEAKLPSIYAGTMSFLGGGRACIGYRFATIEIKIIVTMLLDNFKFSLSDDEIVWKLANIQMPWVAGLEGKGPAMPLTVERV